MQLYVGYLKCVWCDHHVLGIAHEYVDAIQARHHLTLSLLGYYTAFGLSGCPICGSIQMHIIIRRKKQAIIADHWQRLPPIRQPPKGEKGAKEEVLLKQYS